MKDIGLKPDTLRTAQASAILIAPAHCIERLRRGDTEKGDALKTARVAGILAAKRTDELIPMCHSLPIQRAELEFELGEGQVRVLSTVQTIAATGVEMEALLAASVAALTLYDMLKPYATAEQLVLRECRLERKRGGKSQYRRRLAATRRAAVIVLSDSVASGSKPDTAGAAVRDALVEAGFAPVDYMILADDAPALLAAVRRHVEARMDFIVTVGGTGLGPRDLTVDTLQPLLTRELPGLMEAARAFGQRRTPYAMLSRGVAGYLDDTLVATLPGSRRGAEESLAALLPGLVHLFEVFHGAGHAGGYGE